MVGAGQDRELQAFPDFNVTKNQITLSVLTWSFALLRRNNSGCVLYDCMQCMLPGLEAGKFQGQGASSWHGW